MQVKLIKEDRYYDEYEVEFVPTELSQFSKWLHALPHSKVGVKMNGKLYRFDSKIERTYFVYGLDFYIQQPKPLISQLSLWEKIKRFVGWPTKPDEKALHLDGIDDTLKPHEHIVVPSPFFEMVGVEVRSNRPVSIYALPQLELTRFENNLSFQDYDSGHHTCHDTLSFIPMRDEKWFLVIENTNEAETEVNYRISEKELVV